MSVSYPEVFLKLTQFSIPDFSQSDYFLCKAMIKWQRKQWVLSEDSIFLS